MPTFKFTFTRTWTETDTLEREIEAADAASAAAAAIKLCTEFDRDCPDDVVTSKAGEAGTWGIEDIEEVRSDGQP